MCHAIYAGILNPFFSATSSDNPALSPTQLLASLIFRKKTEEALFAIEAADQNKKSYRGNKCLTLFTEAWKEMETASAPICHSDLRNRSTGYNLTALHIATIVEDARLIEKLLKSPFVNTSDRDSHGWTAAHHAAIKTDTHVWELFHKYNAVTSIKSDTDATPEELFAMTHLPSFPPNQVVTHLFDKTSKQLVPCTQERYLNIAEGCRFYDNVYTPSEWLLTSWRRLVIPRPSLDRLETFVQAQYQSYRESPPQFYLKEIEDAGYLLHANQEIKPFQIVIEYCGEHVEEDNETHPCRLDNIDGNDKHRVRGLACFACDSFPNAVTVPMTMLAGRPRVILFSIKPIKRGDPITYDFGPVHAKWDCFPELNEKKMVAFIKAKEKSYLIKCHFSQKKRLNPSQEFSDLMQLTYVLGSPRAFLSLFLKGVIDASYLRSLKSICSHRDVIKNWNCIMSALESFEQIEESPLKEKWRQFVLSRTKNDKIFFCLQYLLYTNQFMDQPENNWEAFTIDIKKSYSELMSKHRETQK